MSQTRLARSARLSTFAMLLALSACGASGGGGAQIEFRGEQPLLPGLALDSGWVPDDSPAAVRTKMTATGAVTAIARATSDGQQLTPVAGSGSLAIEGELSLEVSARVDAISFEDVVDSFGYAIAAEQADFDPFALDMPASLTTMLPAQELGAVPIPGAPGATLVVSVTGGELTTAFAGTCAAAQDGFAQYAGTLTMSGTVVAAATIEVDIMFVITETFGPFEIELPIPETTTPMDLGTLDVASGMPVADMGVCDGVGASTGSDDGGDDVGDTTPHGDAASSSADAEDSSGAADAASSGSDEDDDSGVPPSEDPDYPSPLGGECGSTLLTLDLVEYAVCLPYCGGGQTCPPGVTGAGVAGCAYNPQSSYRNCLADADCEDSGVTGETCIPGEGYCSLKPNFCVLRCNAEHVCPDAMACADGVCMYAK